MSKLYITQGGPGARAINLNTMVDPNVVWWPSMYPLWKEVGRRQSTTTTFWTHNVV